MYHLGVNFPDDENYWKTQYIESLSTPDHWLFTADGLLLSLDLLQPSVVATFKALTNPNLSNAPPLHPLGTYMMLAAFLLENLFKALIIANENFAKSDFECGLPQALNTHDLTTLSQKTSSILSITEESNDLLTRLSAYAYWAGRYPAPTSFLKLKPVQLTSWASGVTRTLRGSDPRSIELMVQALYSQFGRQLPEARTNEQYPDKVQHWETVVIVDAVKPAPLNARASQDVTDDI